MMNWSRIAVAAVAAWVVSMALGYLVNNFLFAGLYEANAAAFVSEEQIMRGLPIGFGVMLAGFLVFAYTYAKGYEGGSGLAEGLRFGLLVGIMLVCFVIVWNWVTTPISGNMALAMAGDYIVEFLVYGAIVGLIYKPAPKPAT
jgi:hypothetical protein